MAQKIEADWWWNVLNPFLSPKRKNPPDSISSPLTQPSGQKHFSIYKSCAVCYSVLCKNKTFHWFISVSIINFLYFGKWTYCRTCSWGETCLAVRWNSKYMTNTRQEVDDYLMLMNMQHLKVWFLRYWTRVFLIGWVSYRSLFGDSHANTSSWSLSELAGADITRWAARAN